MHFQPFIVESAVEVKKKVVQSIMIDSILRILSTGYPQVHSNVDVANALIRIYSHFCWLEFFFFVFASASASSATLRIWFWSIFFPKMCPFSPRLKLVPLEILEYKWDNFRFLKKKVQLSCSPAMFILRIRIRYECILFGMPNWESWLFWLRGVRLREQDLILQ